MFKKIIYLNILLMSMVFGAVVNTNKANYNPNEKITVSFSGMHQKNDWIGIYPVGSSNDWGNQVAWAWTNDKVKGKLNFDGLPVGDYEVRAFFNSSFKVEVTKQFRVIANVVATSVDTNKATYNPNEEITVSFSEMHQNNDWIGIYPVGSSNDWGNQVAWAWTNDQVQGNLNFNGLPVGDYEVRAFFNNSFNVEATKQFHVTGNAVVTSVDTNKTTYNPNENITVSFSGMQAQNKDWIGIYPVGSSNDWANQVGWAWTNDQVEGNLNFDGLPIGDYEVRAFFNNSFNVEATHVFKVENNNNPPIARVLYDDFEDGIDPRWQVFEGRPMRLLNVGAIDGAVGHKERQVEVNGQHSLRTYLNGGYYFVFNQPDVRLKFLEIDMKIGVSSHLFNFGVGVRTTKGYRVIEFHSWLNHTLASGGQVIRGPYGNVLEGHREAFMHKHTQLHPAPSDYYVATSHVDGGENMFVHYKIDIEEKLKLLEPDNELLEILLFSVSGGDYDNLALSSQ